MLLVLVFFCLIMCLGCHSVSFKRLNVFCLLSSHRLSIAILCKYKYSMA